MADNYLENQYEQFLKRKKEMELKKRIKPKPVSKPKPSNSPDDLKER